MVLFLKKLLPVLCSPLFVALALLALAWGLRRRWPAIVAVVLLYVFSNGVVADWMLDSLESQYPPVAVAAAGPADAVVVLGGIFGAVQQEEEGFVPNVGEAGERLEAGIRLLQQNRAPLLVFTGAVIPWERRSMTEGERSRREAVLRGVPASKILITGEVGDTVDEAGQIAALSRQRGWKRVIVVTSAWHMPRAARLLRWSGVPVTPFPVDYLYDARRQNTLIDFLPTAGALATTTGVLREWYGIAFYTMLGRY